MKINLELLGGNERCTNLYEIWNISTQDSNWPLYKISWRSEHICARTSCKSARTRFIASVRAYKLCTGICLRIFIKFKTLVYKIVIDHPIKFHKDRSFRCGDICKTILVFFNRWFSMYFSYSPDYTPLKPLEMDNYIITIHIFGN